MDAEYILRMVFLKNGGGRMTFVFRNVENLASYMGTQGASQAINKLNAVASAILSNNSSFDPCPVEVVGAEIMSVTPISIV